MTRARGYLRIQASSTGGTNKELGSDGYMAILANANDGDNGSDLYDSIRERLASGAPGVLSFSFCQKPCLNGIAQLLS